MKTKETKSETSIIPPVTPDSLRGRFEPPPEPKTEPELLDPERDVTPEEAHGWTMKRQDARAAKQAQFTPGEVRTHALLERLIKVMGGAVPALVPDSEIFDEATRKRQALCLTRAALGISQAYNEAKAGRSEGEEMFEDDDPLPKSSRTDTLGQHRRRRE